MGHKIKNILIAIGIMALMVFLLHLLPGDVLFYVAITLLVINAAFDVIEVIHRYKRQHVDK